MLTRHACERSIASWRYSRLGSASGTRTTLSSYVSGTPRSEGLRYVSIAKLTSEMFAEASGERLRALLFRSHMKLVPMQRAARQEYIRRNGPRKWSAVRDWLIAKLGKKCWYTEVELIGAHLVIDHFRPA